MHVRVSRGQYDPQRRNEEELTALTEKVAAAVKTQPGFLSFQSGLDRQAGTFVAISTWQDEGSANFNRETLGPLIAQLMEAGVQLEPPAIYEVNVTA